METHCSSPHLRCNKLIISEFNCFVFAGTATFTSQVSRLLLMNKLSVGGGGTSSATVKSSVVILVHGFFSTKVIIVYLAQQVGK